MAVKLENKSARILHINLGDGGIVTVPPSDPATGGGITVELDDAEQDRFDKAIATPAVKEWIDAGELVITDDGPTEPPPIEPPAADAEPKQPPARTPERKHKFFGDKDKEP